MARKRRPRAHRLQGCGAAGLGARTGAGNKACAFLREGVPETKPATGEKLTPYFPPSRLPGRQAGRGGADARARGVGPVARSPLPTPHR